MKKFLPLLALALCACGSISITYDIDVQIEDDTVRSKVLFSSLRVIERRLASMGEEASDLDLKRATDQMQIYVEVSNQAVLDALTENLTSPFDLSFQRQAGEEEVADIVVEGQGGFIRTGVNQNHVSWMEPSEEPGGTGRITIIFTDEGRAMMADIFNENVGSNLGLFVRDQLVSVLYVDTPDVLDDIIISEIPSAELAQVFADDVNVGLHVTFTPVQ